MTHCKLFMTALIAVTLTLPALAEDWPQWGRTNHRNMVQPDPAKLPATFEPGMFKDGTEEVDMATTRYVLWVARMGSQTYGNPTVANGRVYVGTNNDARGDARFKGDQSLVLCLDEKTGKVIWKLNSPKLGAGKVGDWEYLGMCSSPGIFGDRGFYMGNRCEIVAFDTKGLFDGNDGPFKNEAQYFIGDGKPPVELRKEDADIIWTYDMPGELGVSPHNITSSSPLIVGNKVFANTSNGADWSHTNVPNPLAPTLICVDRETGKLLGEEVSGISTRLYHSSWSSPTSGEVNGKTQVYLGAGDGFVYAYDPNPIPDPQDPDFNILKEIWRYDCNLPEYHYKTDKDGKFILDAAGNRIKRKYGDPDGPNEIISTPVFYKGRVYVATGQDPEHGDGVGNLVCIDPTGQGDVTETKKVWNYPIGRTISTPAIADDLVFIADYAGYVYCIDAMTGKLYWKHDTMAHIWGSPLVADGKVYLGNEDGIVTVFQAGKEKKMLAEIEMPGTVYSSAIAANGVLYIATNSHLYAIGYPK